MRIQRGVALPVLSLALAGLFTLVVPLPAQAWPWVIHVKPGSGPTGAIVRVHGSGFAPSGTKCSSIHLLFVDADGNVMRLGGTRPDATGSFHKKVAVPTGAVLGVGAFGAFQAHYECRFRCVCSGGETPTTTPFTVTAASANSRA